MEKSTIILLEDDLHLSALFKLCLEDQGYRVICRENSAGLADLVRSDAPDLVITDLVMPDHDGMEAIFTLLRDFNIPIIVVSAYAEYMALITDLVQAGLVKPVKPEQLLEEVKLVLAQHGSV